MKKISVERKSKMLKFLLGIMKAIIVVSAVSFGGYMTLGSNSNLAYSNHPVLHHDSDYQTRVKSVQKFIGVKGPQLSIQGHGTSWLIDLGPNMFMTVNHNISNDPEMRYFIQGSSSNKVYEVEILHTNRDYDLALFKIKKQKDYEDFMRYNHNPSPLIVKEYPVWGPKEGSFFWGIGNPLSQDFLFWQGYVSRTDYVSAYDSFRDYGQRAVYDILDGKTTKGASGSPIFDENGYVIGIIQSEFYESAEVGEITVATGVTNFIYSVNTKTIHKFLEEWKNNINNRACTYEFGINYTDPTVMTSDWLTINQVFTNGLFDGVFRMGDTKIELTTTFHHFEFKRPADVYLARNLLICGETIKLTFERNGVRMSVEKVVR